MWWVRGLIALQISARRRVFALLYPPRTNITSAIPARPVDSCCRRAVALQIVLNTRTSGNRFIAAATNAMRFSNDCVVWATIPALRTPFAAATSAIEVKTGTPFSM